MTFPTEAERVKWRDFYEFIRCGCDFPNCVTCYNARCAFDAKFPPVVDAPKNLADVVERAKWGSAPSPAFAAAVEAYGARCRERHAGFYTTEAMVSAARAALVRCHLEEVERGR